MNDPLIGQQLANFRVNRVLGHGGMATVYLGQDIKLQRPVAIKVLDSKYRSDPAYAKRFVNEARMMAKWRHENIIQIYYADEERGISYYVMEFVDGQDLSSILGLYAEKKELMPIADILRIGKAVAGALDYAHGQGVVHRDVKPSNILISKDGRVLLGDFGMALEVRDGSMGSIFGTPHYISPEQAKRSADAVPQSDLYSLGVILYEILSGEVPFNDPSPASIALQHISQKPPSPRKFNPLIGVAVEAVLLKALEKEPRGRYPSGAQLMEALEDAFKAGESSPKIPLPPLPVGVPTVRRSESSVVDMAKLDAPRRDKGVTIHERLASLPPTVHASSKPRQKRNWIWFLALFLLLGLGGWYAAQSGSPFTTVPATGTLTSSPPPPTETPVPPTSTEIPASATSISTAEVIPTNTASLQPTETPIPPSDTPAPTDTVIATQTSLPTSTATLELAATILPLNAVPTIKYPNGFRFSFFWNETSFFMLNNYGEPRSFAAFAFERLDANDQPTDRFTGHRWENGNYTYLPQKFCASIKIYGDEDPPYISPKECGGYASIVQPRAEKDRALVFWSPKNDGSTHFRVIFAGEEVGRCEIGAGTCEVYIP